VFVCFVSSEYGSVKVVRFTNLHLTRTQTCHLSCRNFAFLQTDSNPTTSGASGFIDTIFGGATGTAVGGGFGLQVGTAAADTRLGSLTFDGTTTVNGAGGFGGGLLSLVDFNVVPGVPGLSGKLYL
jgi:hypothetical protein